MTDTTSSSVTFECLLASSEIPTLEEIPFPTMMSYKYDGMRCEIVDGIAMSRKMLPFPNHFLQKWVGHNAAFLTGFDCELIVGAPNLPTTFHTTQSGVNTEEGRPDFKLYVLDNWDMEGSPAEDRYAYLQSFFEILPAEVAERCVLVGQLPARLPIQVKDFYDKAIHEGYEGIMLKRADRPYKYGRSTLKEGILLKWKEFADSEIKIDSIKQGSKNTNVKTKDELGKSKRSSHKAGKVSQDIIGGFVGKDINPLSPFYGKLITVGPGSFSKDALRLLWRQYQVWLASNSPATTPSPVLGRIMTYKYQVAGVKDLPRYPSAKGFRAPLDT